MAPDARSPTDPRHRDGRRLSRPIVDQLAADDHPAKIARSANHANALAVIEPPALVLLGVLDTPAGALALLRAIRSGGPDALWQPDVPVILLSPSIEEPDLLRAFEAGADHVMAYPPPSYLELRARLGALLRRSMRRDNRVLQVGPLRIDTTAYTATLHDRHLNLRQMEYNLLVHLASEPWRVFGKQELLRAVWGYPVICATRTLDSHASRLRCKLNAVGGRWVINVRGVGYRLL
ncbi:MAG TPA: response regulator transcription factor [Solirubrobacteraceae bacterium]|nr:response regulator transcription factor [Solirubrobacteraceae bacterium]